MATSEPFARTLADSGDAESDDAGEGCAPATRITVQTRLVDAGASPDTAGQAAGASPDAAQDRVRDDTVNPLEIILTALGTSQEITYRHFAERLGIPLHKVSITLSGDMDMRGLERSGGPSGVQGIEAWVTLHSPAPPAELEKLVNIVTSHCPVLNLCTHGTHVRMNVRHQVIEVA